MMGRLLHFLRNSIRFATTDPDGFLCVVAWWGIPAVLAAALLWCWL